MPLPNRTSSAKHELAPGLTLMWSNDGRIATLTLTDSTRTVIDEWVDTILAIHETCPYPAFQILNDMVSFSATPYFQDKVSSFGSMFNNGKKGRFAVLLPNNVLGFIHRLFLQRHLKNTIVKTGLEIEGKAFLSRDNAIEWLDEVSVTMTINEDVAAV